MSGVGVVVDTCGGLAAEGLARLSAVHGQVKVV
jgi:hypothetical protein